MFFFRLLSRLPLSVLYLLSDLLYLAARYLINYRKKVIDQNLQFAFPEKTAEERKKIRNRFYRNFTDAFVAETIKMLSISEKEMRERFEVVGVEHLNATAHSDKSKILMVGHVFNWEMGLLITNLVSNAQVETIYKKLNNGLIEQIMHAARTRFGGTMTEMANSGRSLATLKSKPRLLILAADQRPAPSSKRFVQPFLNRDAAFFVGGEAMANKFDVPVIFGFFERKERGYYRLTYKPLSSPPYAGISEFSITQAYRNLLEINIREQPDLYLWSHKRWKL